MLWSSAPRRLSALFAASSLCLLACGGSVEGDLDSTLPHDAGDSDPIADAGESDAPSAVPDAGDDKDAPDYVDPSCPDVPIEPPYLECDPLAPPPSGCSLGEACYPFVIYPQSECGQESYGARCIPEGTGKQGTACGNGENHCAAGFVCVISGAGTQCVKLCALDGIGVCEEGLVCEPIDVAGFGGCL